MEQCSRTGSESGLVLVSMVASVLPLLLVAGAVLISMSGRNQRLLNEIRQDKALLAAESGLDEALYRASTSAGLPTGLSFKRDMGAGMSFEVLPSYLKTDGLDNDKDGLTDELDENVFQLSITGRCGNATRKIVGYLGQASGTGAVQAAVAVQNTGMAIAINGLSRISGYDTNLDGTRGNPAQDLQGLTIAPPGTLGTLSSKLNASELAKVSGLGGTPSIGVSSSALDVAELGLIVQNSANIVLTSTAYSGLQFGNAAAGDFNIIYRNGNLVLKNGSRGAGIMVVTGSLHTEGSVRFDGIVVVLGDLELHGSTEIYGGLIAGPASPHLTLEGSTRIINSAAASSGANAMVPGKWSVFNGWQEVSRF